MINEIVTLIANIALALSVVVAVIFGIAQVKTAARDRRERLTVDTLRNFQTREFAEMIHFITSHQVPTTAKEMATLPEEDQLTFIQLAQSMESLGILVAEGLIDIDLVDKTLGSFVTTCWEKYEPRFLDLRVNQPDPYLGEYFQWLSELITKRMQEQPRQPFHESHTSVVETKHRVR